jgi:8-oxo-dGTP pyrophosphatase MutT (NUDIX family)
MTQPVPVETQVSSGGVAFRRSANGVEVALISVGDPARWQLPKGIVSPGERNEDAAQREVREEAGITTELQDPLDRIEYWYYGNQSGQRIRYHKFVYFFLMRYRSGDVSDHDHEVNEARWFEIGQALEALAFENEKRILGLARERILTLQCEESA